MNEGKKNVAHLVYTIHVWKRPHDETHKRWEKEKIKRVKKKESTRVKRERE